MEQAIITENRSGRLMPSVPTHRKKMHRKPNRQDEFTITPELQAQIDKEIMDYKAGRGVTLHTPEDVHKFFREL